MRTTAAQKRLFFGLRRLKGQMHTVDDADLRAEQIANVFKILGGLSAYRQLGRREPHNSCTCHSIGYIPSDLRFRALVE